MTTTSRLTPAQYEFLTGQLAEGRVRQLRGNSHLEAWDIRRNLIRAFGFFGFDIKTKALDLVAQIEHAPQQANGKSRWTVVYRAEVQLIIKAPDGSILGVFEDGAAGDSQNQPSLGDAHDQAMKTALSQGLKRCAVNCGDQFGLSLYNDGQTKRVVVRSLVHPELPTDDAPATPSLPTDDAPVMPEPGTETATDQHQAEPKPEAVTPPARPAPTAPGVRDWALEPDRTADGIRKAAAKLRSEHPAVAAQVVTNEHGDDEELSDLMERRARELTPAAAQPADDPDKRRKRMFALFRDLGFSGDANREQRHKIASHVLGREITSMTEVVGADQEQVITALEERKRTQGAAA